MDVIGCSPWLVLWVHFHLAVAASSGHCIVSGEAIQGRLLVPFLIAAWHRPHFETAWIMRDRSENARQENAREHRSQQPVSRTIGPLRLRGRQPGNPMAQ